MFKRVWKWIALAIAVAGLIIFGRNLPLLAWMKQLADFIHSLGAWGVVLFILLYVGAALLCVPCMPLTVAGGFLFGPAAGFLAVHTAAIIGAAAGYSLSRHSGRARVAEAIRHSERFRFFDAMIAKEGWKIVGLLRMTPVNFGLANYIYGLTAIDFWHYLLATFFAMLPGHLIFTYLGSIGAETLAGHHQIHLIEWIGSGMSMAATLLLALMARRILRRHEIEKPSGEPSAPRD